jgi:hypothetical protein
MKTRNKVRNITLIISLIGIILFLSRSEIQSHPFEAKNDATWGDCDTRGLYDANTTVTFYGDSRSDLADDYWAGVGWVPIYGHFGLDFHLGANPTVWNVQNMGHSTWKTDQLLSHLRNCMQSVDGKAKFKSQYLTSKNVAFEIAGNDFALNTIGFILNPWSLPSMADHVLNNTELIIRTFQKKGKEKILLIGGYPALGYSFSRGMNLEYGLNLYPDASLAEISPNFYPQFSACPAYKNNDFLHGANLFLLAIGGKYENWIKVSTKAFGMASSLGLMRVETLYNDLVSRRKIDYISPWGCMQGKSGEMWLATPALMRDPAHPNFWGFAQWGIVVKNAMSSLGLDRQPSTSTIAPPPDSSIPEILPPTNCSYDVPAKTVSCGGRWFEAYSFTFTGTDGYLPYTFTTRNLPAGASVSNTGVFSFGPTFCANTPLMNNCNWSFDLIMTDGVKKTDTLHVRYGTGL